MGWSGLVHPYLVYSIFFVGLVIVAIFSLYIGWFYFVLLVLSSSYSNNRHFQIGWCTCNNHTRLDSGSIANQSDSESITNQLVKVGSASLCLMKEKKEIRESS